jgi:hypothetical protein
MKKAGPTALVLLRQNADGTFTVLDAAGQPHHADGLVELGQACAQVLADDSLPEVEAPTEMQMHIESVATHAAELLARKATSAGKALAPFVVPTVKAVTGTITRRVRTSANARQQTRDVDRGRDRVAARRRLLAQRGMAS